MKKFKIDKIIININEKVVYIKNFYIKNNNILLFQIFKSILIHFFIYFLIKIFINFFSY